MEQKSGVYIITNLINKKIYVGSSINIKLRWANHKSDLRRGTHRNKHLQRAWNKYGEENFNFKILEECDIEGLTREEAISKVQNLEQKYLDSLNPYNINGYNEEKKATGGKNRATWENALNGDLNYSIEAYEKVIEMLKNPQFSYRMIEKETSMSKTNIISIYKKESLKEFTQDIFFPSRKFQCKYNKGTKGIKIYKYDIYGNLVKEYPSMTQALNEAKCEFQQIRKCCENKIPTAGGYYYSFNDSPREFTKIEQLLGHYIIPKNGKPIIEYINDIPVNVYESIKQIQEFSINVLRRILTLEKPKIISQDYKYFIKYAEYADEKDLDYLISNKKSK